MVITAIFDLHVAEVLIELLFDFHPQQPFDPVREEGRVEEFEKRQFSDLRDDQLGGRSDIDLPELEEDEELQEVHHVPEVFEPVGKEYITDELDGRKDGHWAADLLLQLHKLCQFRHRHLRGQIDGELSPARQLFIVNLIDKEVSVQEFYVQRILLRQTQSDERWLGKAH